MLAIFFLSAYLISTTELSQLLKFPVLVEHYFQHKEKDPEMSVMSFLSLHYDGRHLDNHPHDDDYEKDQKLPFIVHTDILSISFIVTPPFCFGVTKKAFIGKVSKALPLDDTFLENTFLSTIWQPPKFC